MAHTVSAKKRIRQNVRRRSRNRWRKRIVRSAVKDVRASIQHGTVEDAETAFKNACAALDRAAGKGVIHRNTAARTKSRLSARILEKKQGA